MSRDKAFDSYDDWLVRPYEIETVWWACPACWDKRETDDLDLITVSLRLGDEGFTVCKECHEAGEINFVRRVKPDGSLGEPWEGC